jgi:hypothetical protein
MDDMIRLGLEVLLFGGVVCALVGSVVTLLFEELGYAMFKVGMASILSFVAIALVILAGSI